MASDEIDEKEAEGGGDDAPEIIAKPPSHPITTTLIAVQIVATILCIVFVWAELFGSYMPSKAGPVQKGMEKHDSVGEAKRPAGPKGPEIDHYAEDFPDAGKEVLWRAVGRDLKVLDEGN